MMRGKIAAALATIVFIASAPASADYNGDATKCEGTAAQGFTPEVIIAGCTGVIQSDDASASAKAGSYYNRANAHYDKGEFELAVHDFDQAIRLRPNFPTALNNRGLAKKRMGDDAGGDADIQAAAALKAQHP
jgi:lipoprotein NlpI